MGTEGHIKVPSNSKLEESMQYLVLTEHWRIQGGVGAYLGA